MANKVFVIGGTGSIGTFLINKLLEDKTDVRLLIRNESQAEKLKNRGADVVIGDLNQPESLSAKIRGCDKMFLLTSPSSKMLGQESAAIREAKKAGVQHLVKISVLGCDNPNPPMKLSSYHLASESQIKELEFSYSFLRPASFMQNFFMHIPTVKSQKAIYSPLKNGLVSYIDARDIADVAYHCLVDDHHLNKVYNLTGPEAISMDRVANEIGKHTGVNVNHIPVSFDQAKKSMISAGLSEWLVNDLIELNKRYEDDGMGHFISNDYEEITGSKPGNISDFVRDFAHLFMPRD